MEIPEQIQISGDKDKQIELLCFQRDTRAGLGCVDLEQEHKDGQEVKQVRRNSEDIHGELLLPTSFFLLLSSELQVIWNLFCSTREAGHSLPPKKKKEEKETK